MLAPPPEVATTIRRILEGFRIQLCVSLPLEIFDVIAAALRERKDDG